MEHEIKSYIYIDEKGIDSLYCQLPNKVIPVKSTMITNFNGKLSSGFCGGILKLLSANATTEVGANHQVQEERQENLSFENKIDSILQYCNKGNIKDLFEILENDDTDRLIVCTSAFRFKYAQDEENGCMIFESDICGTSFKVLQPKKLSFCFVSVPQLSQYSYGADISRISSEYYVDMIFDAAKLVRNVRHLTNYIKYGCDFKFTIIGDIMNMGNKTFSLKPFAIWRMNT